MSEMNCSTLSLLPVISKMKLVVPASMTLARKASARRRASTRFSPVPATFTMASSRVIELPCTVRSATEWTGTSLASWFLICSITEGVPLVTTVMRETCFSCCVSETVSDSML